jgi:hypothetical protein
MRTGSDAFRRRQHFAKSGRELLHRTFRFIGAHVWKLFVVSRFAFSHLLVRFLDFDHGERFWVFRVLGYGDKYGQNSIVFGRIVG